ncbi:MAG: hypothetical protein K8R36_15180, partial [Planctomycetales bacterium]|nr:hypothetical protein [Planctomycetales bacterium]
MGGIAQELIMGLFYTTFTTIGPDRQQVVAALQMLGRTAFVGPSDSRCTVIYDRLTEEQDFEEVERFGKELSKACDGPVFAAALHDDDVLYLWLFDAGNCCDFYNSMPQYFDPDAEPGPPEGGDSALLCRAFARPHSTERVETILRANLLEDEFPEIPGEFERH